MCRYSRPPSARIAQGFRRLTTSHDSPACGVMLCPVVPHVNPSLPPTRQTPSPQSCGRVLPPLPDHALEVRAASWISAECLGQRQASIIGPPPPPTPPPSRAVRPGVRGIRRPRSRGTISGQESHPAHVQNGRPRCRPFSPGGISRGCHVHTDGQPHTPLLRVGTFAAGMTVVCADTCRLAWDHGRGRRRPCT